MHPVKVTSLDGRFIAASTDAGIHTILDANTLEPIRLIINHSSSWSMLAKYDQLTPWISTIGEVVFQKLFELLLIDSDRTRRDKHAYIGHSSAWAKLLELGVFEMLRWIFRVLRHKSRKMSILLLKDLFKSTIAQTSRQNVTNKDSQ